MKPTKSKCSSSRRYRGIQPPKCLGGKGCEVCWVKFNNRRTKEAQQYISLYVADELQQRFEGRKISDINDHEIVDIITRLLSAWPREDEWAWARKEGKKLGVTGAELLAMRFSQANALALKKGLTWAITPK